jgi:predicted nucleic acid-binding protein
MIVSNATPLIAFARIGELALLERIVEQLTVPEAVWQEVTGVPDHVGSEAIRQATWIDVERVSEVSADLLALLDRGEAEVIALVPGRIRRVGQPIQYHEELFPGGCNLP